MVNTHAIIAGNRVWAIIFPLSYRSLHTRHFAMVTCGIMWVIVHFFEAGFITYEFRDLYYSDTDVEKLGCILKSTTTVMAWAKASDLTQWFNVVDISGSVTPYPGQTEVKQVYRAGTADGSFGQNKLAFKLSLLVYTCQPMVNAILFVLALDPLRRSVVWLLTCREPVRIHAASQ
ncbi:hypothetical protein BV898_15369 [Hypsibius exemplaris]|uniref:7TM GPCR serpentine receptor class x (Srx) domain-containing protein n=1 Tax=Hypsibius exemplaris TaxID=2072580 RepID=A0A9X6NDR9_HYPEX|nr:hypothetical protein BV898_15369 [Hypsibius exemplaris]